MKKAAMFGLDARIALAIFGALSVISGAALYSAIQQSKVTSFIAQQAENSKAFEAFYIDTGRYLTRIAGVDMQQLAVEELYEDTGDSGWSGPYLSNEYDSADHTFNPTPEYSGRFELYESDTWGLEISNVDLVCGAGEDCSVWIITYNMPRDFADNIDLAVDGSASPTTGNFRIWGTSSIVNTMYRVMLYKGN